MHQSCKCPSVSLSGPTVTFRHVFPSTFYSSRAGYKHLFFGWGIKERGGEEKKKKKKKECEMALMCNRYSFIPFEGYLHRNCAFSTLPFFPSPLAYFLSVLIFPQTWKRVGRASTLDGFDVCAPLTFSLHPCVCVCVCARVCMCVCVSLHFRQIPFKDIMHTTWVILPRRACLYCLPSVWKWCHKKGRGPFEKNLKRFLLLLFFFNLCIHEGELTTGVLYLPLRGLMSGNKTVLMTRRVLEDSGGRGAKIKAERWTALPCLYWRNLCFVLFFFLLCLSICFCDSRKHAHKNNTHVKTHIPQALHSAHVEVSIPTS